MLSSHTAFALEQVAWQSPDPCGPRTQDSLSKVLVVVVDVVVVEVEVVVVVGDCVVPQLKVPEIQGLPEQPAEGHLKSSSVGISQHCFQSIWNV